MRAIQRSPFGHPVPMGRGWQPPAPAMGSAYGMSRQQQIQQYMAEGYSRKEAREIADMDLGYGPGGAKQKPAGPGWQEIVGGILDVGGQVVTTFTQQQQASRSNVGLDVAAGNLATQQGRVDVAAQQAALNARSQQQASNTAVYVVLGVGGVAALGFLVYALTRK